MSSAGLADHEGLVKRFLSLSNGTQPAFRRTLRALGMDPSPNIDVVVQPPQLIRLFTHDNFYTAHGRDALLLADQYIGGRAGVLQWGDGRDAIPTLCISSQFYERLVPALLTVLGCSIEQYNPRPGSKTEWVRTKLATPGNIAAFAELIEASSEVGEAPTVLSVILEECPQAGSGASLVHVALLNTTTKTLGLATFQDDRYLTLLSSLLHANNIKECIKQQGASEQLDTLLTSSGVSTVNGLEGDYILDGLLDTIEHMIGNIPPAIETTYPAARKALSALLARLGITGNEESVNRCYTYQPVALDALQISAQDAQILGIFPAAGRGASLATTVNRCVTPEGKQILGMWLRQPLTDITQITTRQEAVSALVEDVLTRDELRKALRILPTAGGAINRISVFIRPRDGTSRINNNNNNNSNKMPKAGRKALADICRLYIYALRMHAIVDHLNGAGPELLSSTGKSLAVEGEHLKGFENLVETVVDLGALENNEYTVKSEYSEELANIRAEQETLREQMLQIARKFEPIGGRRRSPNASDEVGHRPGAITLTSTPTQGYFLKGGKTVLKTLKGNSSVMIIENGVNFVKFVTPQLRKLGTQYEALQKQSDEEQSKIIQEIVRVGSSYMGVFSRIVTSISIIDALCSLAVVAAEKGWVRPELVETEEPYINVTGLRHPVLETVVDFIPNDVRLGIGEDGTPGAGRFMVLTGPNMGGKTTYLKSIALCSLLSQVGSFVPCTPGTVPRLSIFGRILVRAGAGDSVNSGRSTFMNEMVEISSILSITALEEKRTKPRASLVLIDELGRGTSTHDGYGLSYAIAKDLVSHPHVLTVFATHIHQLTTLERDCATENYSPVSNFHASAEVDSAGVVSLTYTILPGANRNSYGIQVARMAGYPVDVLQDAETRLHEYKQKEKTNLSGDVEAGTNTGLLSRLRCALALYVSCRRGVGAAGIDEMQAETQLRAVLEDYYKSKDNENKEETS